MDNNGKVAVVTGAGRGIGKAIALHLAREGWSVVVNDNGAEIDGSGGSPAVAQAVADEIETFGGRAAANTDTVGSWEVGQRLAAAAQEHFGPVDLLVNNAAILRDRMSFNMSADEWDQVVEQNLSGSFFCARALLPSMRERKAGRIVNIVSTTGPFGNASQANYASSKGGMITLTRVLAMDMAKYGVTVNAVSPFAHTRDTERIAPMNTLIAEYMEGALTIPPEDVAPIVSFLASDAAKDITGQLIGVRGKEVMLFSQPRPIRTAVKLDGWDPASLSRTFQSWASALTPLENDLEYFRYKPFV